MFKGSTSAIKKNQNVDCWELTGQRLIQRSERFWKGYLLHEAVADKERFVKGKKEHSIINICM